VRQVLDISPGALPDIQIYSNAKSAEQTCQAIFGKMFDTLFTLI